MNMGLRLWMLMRMLRKQRVRVCKARSGKTMVVRVKEVR
jgi:hypothetical protein